MTLRSALYAVARFMGDISAVRRHRIGQRIERRVLGRVAGRVLGRLMR